MKRFIRSLAFCLALSLAFCCMGCSGLNQLSDALRGLAARETPAPSATPVPEQTAAPQQETPAPAEPEPAAAGELLAALDLALFKKDMESDPLTLKLTLKNPDALGIGMPEATWGELSYEETMRTAAEYEAFLTQLEQIDRSALSEDEQLTYDTIAQELYAFLASAEYYYYDEVLSPYNGLHTNLPFNFVLYDLDNEQDVENYLALLEDAARYMAEDVLRFEQEKAELGTFMNDVTLDKVLEHIKDFADAGEGCFLYATFADSLAALNLGADAEAAYLARNDAAVDGLLAAYRTLYDGLDALRGSASGTGALCEYGQEGLDYFEQGLNYAACSEITPDEAYNLLQNEILAELYKYVGALSAEPDIEAQYGTIDLSIGTSEENLSMLEELMADYYPELPAHTVRFIDVPEELEDQFSPAAYLVPPIDDASENTIIINLKTMEEDTRLLDTIAHEGYPGHMYHYIYLRGLVEKTGWYRQNMGLTGYYESWSQSAENFFDEYNTAFSNNYCTIMSADNRISGLLLPAAISIGVHYYGWDEAKISEYVAAYFGEEAAAELAPLYLEIALDDAFYYLEYAVGYSLLQQEQRDAKAELGEAFDLRAFHEAFLSIGPTYFNLIAPRLDAWVAAQR
ncbi:MAG: DUF885 domain-containing protein [Christensenella sp.]|nr:DUF885 domain-containing protein [Christensenella sp.]